MPNRGATIVPLDEGRRGHDLLRQFVKERVSHTMNARDLPGSQLQEPRRTTPARAYIVRILEGSRSLGENSGSCARARRNRYPDSERSGGMAPHQNGVAFFGE